MKNTTIYLILAIIVLIAGAAYVFLKPATSTSAPPTQTPNFTKTGGTTNDNSMWIALFGNLGSIETGASNIITAVKK